MEGGAIHGPRMNGKNSMTKARPPGTYIGIALQGLLLPLVCTASLLWPPRAHALIFGYSAPDAITSAYAVVIGSTVTSSVSVSYTEGFASPSQEVWAADVAVREVLRGPNMPSVVRCAFGFSPRKDSGQQVYVFRSFEHILRIARTAGITNHLPAPDFAQFAGSSSDIVTREYAENVIQRERAESLSGLEMIARVSTNELGYKVLTAILRNGNEDGVSCRVEGMWLDRDIRSAEVVAKVTAGCDTQASLLFRGHSECVVGTVELRPKDSSGWAFLWVRARIQVTKAAPNGRWEGVLSSPEVNTYIRRTGDRELNRSGMRSWLEVKSVEVPTNGVFRRVLVVGQ